MDQVIDGPTYFCNTMRVLRTKVSSTSIPTPHYNDRVDLGMAYPSAINMKSANPCTITVRTFFSITFGRTVNAGGKLWSPFGNTLTLEHSVQFVSRGAWIASLTSRRLK